MVETKTKPKPDTGHQQFNLKSRIIGASAVMFLLIAGFGGWAASAQLSGAVIAQGSIVVDLNVKKIQHQDGGIVAKINVRDGDKVNAGDLLVVLDDTQVRSALGVEQSQLAELFGRRARLSAERDGMAAIKFPAELVALGAEGRQIMAGEQRVFQDNLSARVSQKQQLELRIEQLEQEVAGLISQRDSKRDELKPVASELTQAKSLHDRQLTTISRVNILIREAARIAGAIGGLDAQIARAKGQISEVRVQVLTVDQKARGEAQRELRNVDAKISELSERRIAAEDRLKRMNIRAPATGLVHQLAVHTVGGVVTPAEPLLVVVPDTDRLTIEVRFAPTDIDQLSIGQKAKIRFSAFNQRTTPEVAGKLTHISADVTQDAKTGLSHYLGRLALDRDAIKALGNRKLLPGMPVEVFVMTAERTAITYLTKPFTDQLSRAFRER